MVAFSLLVIIDLADMSDKTIELKALDRRVPGEEPGKVWVFVVQTG